MALLDVMENPKKPNSKYEDMQSNVPITTTFIIRRSLEASKPLKIGKKLDWKVREKIMLGIEAMALFQSSGINSIFRILTPFEISMK